MSALYKDRCFPPGKRGREMKGRGGATINSRFDITIPTFLFVLRLLQQAITTSPDKKKRMQQSPSSAVRLRHAAINRFSLKEHGIMFLHSWRSVRRLIASISGAIVDLVPQPRPLRRRMLLLLVLYCRLLLLGSRRHRWLLRLRRTTEGAVPCVITRDRAAVVRRQSGRHADPIVKIAKVVPAVNQVE